MKSIGIKLADGSFYPLLEEGNPEKRTLDLTTVMDNQTKVQVEVYRTETGSLEGAEYLDTLEITNLKPHENGEPTLCLAIDVDENNELSAEIRDPETGKKSEMQVTLQSRTLAGLNAKNKDEDDVTISDDDLENAGLDDLVEKKEFNSEEIPLPSEDFSFDSVNEPAHAEEDEKLPEEETPAANNDVDIFGENSLDLPEFGAKEEPEEKENGASENADASELNDSAEENTIAEEPAVEETFEEPAAEETEETAIEENENPEEPEASVTEENVPEEKTEDTVTVEETPSDDDIFSTDLPEFNEAIFDDPAAVNSDETAVEEPAEEKTADTEPETPDSEDTVTVEETPSDDDIFSTDLPEFNEAIFDDPTAENSDETAVEENTENSSDNSLDDFSLPDFDDLEPTGSLNENSEDTAAEEKTETADNSADILDLPDFDDLGSTDSSADLSSPAEEDSSIYDLPDFDSDESLTDNSEDFTLPPDFDVKNDGDDILNSDDQPKNPTFAPSTNMFSNLYDKETLEGTSSSYDSDEENGKSHSSKVPMIICIICAIICVLAVLLTLFVLPSNFNILSKFAKNKDEVIVEAMEEEPEETAEVPEITEEVPEAETEAEAVPPAEEPKPEVSPAKEDTIVIAETPAAVVPAEPEPSPEPIPDIRYKIVWGDTLWDISTAYYKTPWKYKKIAKYNKIKNPDHIISGRYILIPAE